MTIGTIEEKIDKMLVEKAALSDDLIQSTNWITELSDIEIDDLMSFRTMIIQTKGPLDKF